MTLLDSAVLIRVHPTEKCVLPYCYGKSARICSEITSTLGFGVGIH